MNLSDWESLNSGKIERVDSDPVFNSLKTEYAECLDSIGCYRHIASNSVIRLGILKGVLEGDGEDNIVIQLGEDSAFYERDLERLDVPSTEVLSDVGLVFSKEFGFPIAAMHIEGKDRTSVVKSAKNNYNSHFFGKKREDISVVFRDGTKLSEHAYSAYENKWGTSPYNFLSRCPSYENSEILSILVKGQLAAELVIGYYDDLCALNLISVIPNEEFRPYSVYGVAHLEGVSRAIEKGCSQVSCGMYYPYKKNLGFDEIVLPSYGIKEIK